MCRGLDKYIKLHIWIYTSFVVAYVQKNRRIYILWVTLKRLKQEEFINLSDTVEFYNLENLIITISLAVAYFLKH